MPDKAQLAATPIFLFSLMFVSQISASFNTNLRTKIPAYNKDFILLVLTLFYFQAGVSKLYLTGLGWLKGWAFSHQMLSNYLISDSQAALFLGSSPVISQMAGSLVIFFELTFFVCVFIRPLRTWYCVFGLIFHTFIYFAMEINFFTYFIFCYLIFIDWTRQKLRISRWILASK